MMCGALSIRGKESPVGTLDESLKFKGEHRLALCLVGKVRVLINIKEPLMRSLRVELLGDCHVKTILLRYDRLLDYCFKCGCLGHSLRECLKPGDGNETISEALMRLNSWLRTVSSPKRFQ
ncbi:hypothetical protein Ddye_000086 [Dipteronia dyeriana]|uniref:CCHC-type domain-containing protein n=1 Tax=Dipteronia dyeriana TaxID=168575 RepID=A0AAE0CS79_9ROSI|nr:hypothetical protein Ddye_000086 [Dipteronia dyeriana]